MNEKRGCGPFFYGCLLDALTRSDSGQVPSNQVTLRALLLDVPCGRLDWYHSGMAKRDQKKSKRKEKLRKQKLREEKVHQKKHSATGFTVTDSNLNEAMTVAVRLHKDGELTDAERIYRQVLKITPDHPDALSSFAMIEYQNQRFEKAIKRMRQAISLVDNNAGYHMNLATVLDRSGELEEAVTHYGRAIALAPDYPDPYYNLGDLYLREGRPDKAIEVFDECMSVIGREFHALAYKAHALDDANRQSDARYLLNFDDYVKSYRFDTPDGYDSIESFNSALARHIKMHPTLQGNVMSTEHGKHTAELLREPRGPMEAMEARIVEAIHWYKKSLPDDPSHPAVRWAPKQYKLTSWGVVMFDKGHERAHIHPNGWLSGVFYLQLPDVIHDSERDHEGWLEFGRPTADLHVRSALHLRHYMPAYGEMFLFPSYFYHGTIPFRSRERRISVAFDVEPVHR